MVPRTEDSEVTLRVVKMLSVTTSLSELAGLSSHHPLFTMLLQKQGRITLKGVLNLIFDHFSFELNKK